MFADRRRTLRPLLIGGLLALATVFFLWGSFAERSGHHEIGSGRNAATGQPAEGGESVEHHASEGQGAGPAESEYRPLGVNLESTPLVVTAALISFALAAVVALRPGRPVLGLAAILAFGFVLLEIVEVAHQADRGNRGLLVLALVAGLLHAAVGVLAISAAVVAPRTVRAVPAE